MIPAIVVAVSVPLLFLYLVRWLDLYASGSFQAIVICLLWGVAAFILSFQANTFAFRFVGFGLLVALVAPIIEEILKSLILIYYIRRPDFTYFVDGAIYGFASGTAFAVLENLLYLGRGGSYTSLSVALSRAFSTSLMHGSASALVGVSLGRLRFGRGFTRMASVLLGWAAATALHITFNNVVNLGNGTLTLLLAVAIGLGGVGFTAAFILWGLSEERRWLRETLGLQVGVSAGESAAVQQLNNLDPLLAPIGERFGPDKRKQVEALLRLQAQLGLKRKVQEMTPDSKLRTEMDAQVTALRQEIDIVRRDLGLYCMAYVRSILPPETEPIWAHLGRTLATSETSSARSVWSTLSDKMEKGGRSLG
jgi:RsiW-degrading membrane proteinase PrsW (M82 family)